MPYQIAPVPPWAFFWLHCHFTLADDAFNVHIAGMSLSMSCVHRIGSQQPPAPVGVCAQNWLTQLSLVHTLSPSSQSMSVTQQTSLWPHWFSKQESTVHFSPSLQSLADMQQFASGWVCAHGKPTVGHVSKVQTFASLQSFTVLQHTVGGKVWWLHWWEKLHESMVHTFLSSHSAVSRQQLKTLLWLHWYLLGKQLSDVQTLPSSQTALLSQ